jgi:phage/plasmid-associated DNA primase
MEATLAIADIAAGIEDEWCWTPGLGWLRWDGAVWCPTRDRDALRDRINRDLAAQGHRPLTIAQLRAETAALQEHLRVDADTLGAFPGLLNARNGIVDLRTGELRPHDPNRRMTRITGVDYDPDATSPAWDRVLAAIPEAERDRLRVRLAWAVACEPLDSVALVHGRGPCGKTTFMRAVCDTLGSYAFTTGGGLDNLRTPAERVALMGARVLVMEDVAPKDMANVKLMAVQDRLTVRQPQEDTAQAPRTHSVFAVTAHRPADLAVDEGTERHLHPVEFPALPSPDPAVGRGMRDEGALRAVLRWIVDGAVRYAAA